MFCYKCGKEIDDEAVVCVYCGVANTSKSKPKDKIVALLLCWFLGMVGVHKFYEGKTDMGILYLVCWIFGVVGMSIVGIIMVDTNFSPSGGIISLAIICSLSLFFVGIGVLVDFIKLLSKPNPYYIETSATSGTVLVSTNTLAIIAIVGYVALGIVTFAYYSGPLMVIFTWYAILFTSLAYDIAKEKGENSILWGVLTFLFGIIAMIILLCLTPAYDQKLMKNKKKIQAT